MTVSTLIYCLLSAATAAASPIRVLIVSGESDHDWRATTPAIQNALVNAGRFEVRISESFAGATEKTLAPFDVLALNYNGPRWGALTEKAVESFVRSGKGLVAIHGVSYAFGGFEVKTPGFKSTGIVEPPWPEYRKMVGAYWKDLTKGHGQRHTFPVRFTDRAHPVARGMAETFLASDELYHGQRLEAEAKVLATAYDNPKLGGTGRDEPVLWTLDYGKGRVFHTALGHDGVAMYEPGFLATLARGVEWAATGEVTLPAAIDFESRNKDAVRVMVVTGGHAHDTTFNSLFEGYAEIAPFLSPRNVAFTGDLRKRWDTLALYDFTQEITDKEKEILRDFLESGKGLVVLHHAIADYGAWPWWGETVVGGKYFLKPEGDRPISAVKAGQEVYVQPVGRHPVIAGVPPLHLIEELYKGMWISPKVKVLLETDHPASDKAVAWISPYEKSRVVYIQLGHDRKVHLHPGYRALVKNAVLWSAGR